MKGLFYYTKNIACFILFFTRRSGFSLRDGIDGWRIRVEIEDSPK
jgi:hypothetical protein